MKARPKTTSRIMLMSWGWKLFIICRFCLNEEIWRVRISIKGGGRENFGKWVILLPFTKKQKHIFCTGFSELPWRSGLVMGSWLRRLEFETGFEQKFFIFFFWPIFRLKSRKNNIIWLKMEFFNKNIRKQNFRNVSYMTYNIKWWL